MRCQVWRSKLPAHLDDAWKTSAEISVLSAKDVERGMALAHLAGVYRSVALACGDLILEYLCELGLAGQDSITGQENIFSCKISSYEINLTGCLIKIKSYCKPS